jgi:hypothetical protein
MQKGQHSGALACLVISAEHLLLDVVRKAAQMHGQPVEECAFPCVGGEIANQLALGCVLAELLKLSLIISQAELDNLSLRRTQSGRAQPLADESAGFCLSGSTQKPIPLNTWRGSSRLLSKLCSLVSNALFKRSDLIETAALLRHRAAPFLRRRERNGHHR